MTKKVVGSHARSAQQVPARCGPTAAVRPRDEWGDKADGRSGAQREVAHPIFHFRRRRALTLPFRRYSDIHIFAMNVL